MSSILYRAATLIRADAPARTIYGTAMPFDTPTRVRDGYGEYVEVFRRGAFARTIAERSHKVRLHVQHDRRKLPIGRATELDERPDGLHVAFRISETAAGDDALTLVADGVVSGLSIGFQPVRDERSKDGAVIRTEVRLSEVSLTDAPAYEGALIAGVRSAGRSRLSVESARLRLDLIERSW